MSFKEMKKTLTRAWITISLLSLIQILVAIVGYDIDLSENIFQIANTLYHNRSKEFITFRNDPYYLSKVHLIRIPKASSSSLSMVARRLAGCNPPGPCCRWPGDPPGSCPSKGLFECDIQKRVIGCTHHYPNYPYLLNPAVFSMTMLREPISRSLSAFGYGNNIHFNSNCKDSMRECFLRYIKDHRWSNIAVKMLTGKYSYLNSVTCEFSSQCGSSLELALENLSKLQFIGITEYWEISMLLLHNKLVRFMPLAYEFKARSMNGTEMAIAMAATRRHPAIQENSQINSITKEEPQNQPNLLLRIGSNNIYKNFTRQARFDYADELVYQNRFDLRLYEEVRAKLCDQLKKTGLWGYDAVRISWKESTRSIKSKLKITSCD